jgi:hypothetical protein
VGGPNASPGKGQALRQNAAARVPVQVQRHLEQYDQTMNELLPLRGVTSELRRAIRASPVPGNQVIAIKIKSAFSRALNRRFQWKNFWPGDVSGKPKRWELSPHGTKYKTSPRARWFAVEGARDKNDALLTDAEALGGYDISSSQTQILAVLLGLKKLEGIARAQPFKMYLARRAWRLSQAGRLTIPKYQSSDDEDLISFVKELWLRVLYGSRVGQIVHDADPRWTTAQAQALLNAVPEYQEISRFLAACERLAEVAYKRDPFEGVVFVDPYDGVGVRWNPVHRVETRVESDQQALIVSVPPRPACRRGKYAGDYRVSLRTLKKRIAPCVVHMCDAAYSAFVIETLTAFGVRDVVALHDCWYVPAGIDIDPAWLKKEAAQAEAQNRAAQLAGSSWRVVAPSNVKRPSPEESSLEIAMLSASINWLQCLGSVYDRFVAYLGNDPAFGKDVHRWRNQWQARVAQQAWPRFKATRSELTG